jgi:(p)ppGpp synthase/HD superfamily hydrolase
MAILERAIEIAARAHAGQFDKAGAPYILHPLRVMLACKSPDARVAAVLHDVVEDSPWTLEQLRAEGFSEAVLNAVDRVTKRPDEQAPDDETYFRFVRRAMQDPIAREVKRADLIDNRDLTRISSPTPRDHERLERYRKALEILDAN